MKYPGTSPNHLRVGGDQCNATARPALFGAAGTACSPNLYALLGAESGVGKSLIFNEVAHPLEELDSGLQEEFKELASAMRTELGFC